MARKEAQAQLKKLFGFDDFYENQWKTIEKLFNGERVLLIEKTGFVAQSNGTGGTWAGVIDGLRKGRKIYMRYPEDNEKYANKLLIEKGAIPVDFDGNVLESYAKKSNNIDKEKVLDILKFNELTSEQIIDKLKLNVSAKELDILLQKEKDLEIAGKRPYRYKLRMQPALFTE